MVRLYAAPLDVGDAELARLRATLSADESAAADALGLAVQRRRAVAERGHRRAMLAAELGRDPAAVAYSVDSRRRPRVIGAEVEFSASRSDSVALYAVSEAVVGVDVEAIPRDASDRDLRRLAGRVLTDGERAAWDAVAPSGRAAALYAAWTRKEARGKALGTGLVFPLNRVDVWAGDDRPMRHGDVVVHSVDSGPIAAMLTDVDAGHADVATDAGREGPRLAAAVAVRAEGRAVAISGPSIIVRSGA